LRDAAGTGEEGVLRRGPVRARGAIARRWSRQARKCSKGLGASSTKRSSPEGAPKFHRPAWSSKPFTFRGDAAPSFGS